MIFTNPSFPVDEGLHSALQSAETFLLGGDLGSSAATVLTGVGLGIAKNQPLSRKGIQAGDFLCITGKTGCGPALAFRLLRGEQESSFPEDLFRPMARLNWGQALLGLASAAIDTSDGLLTALDTLRTLNGVGLELHWNPDSLDPRAVEYCKQREIPLWLLWLGEHGDFELLLAIPSEKLTDAKRLCPELHVIGRAVKDPQVTDLQIPERKRIDFKMMRCIESGKKANLSELSERLKTAIEMFRVQGFP